MEFVSENKGFHRNEDEEEEDEGEEVIGHARSFTFPSSSSPYDASKPYQKLYCGTNFDDHSEEDAIRSHHRAHQEPEILGGQEAFPNFNRKLELIDLTLRSSSTDESADGVGSSRDIGSSGGGNGAMEREHMFDKVVTPSDVGKLNRLVIPKQHAEKYFPLNSSANEKDLLLNFEDRNGKPWRFRYSYWNSSQSYVMTKGWSRFVKEKKLGAGDIVSFQRGVGESGRDRLYIDFRHRPEAHDHQSLLSPLPSVPWGRLYSVPPPMSVAMSMLRGHHDQHLQQPTYNIAQPFPFHHHRVAGHSRDIHEFRPANLGPPSIYCYRPSVPHQIGAVRFGYVGPNSEPRSPAATSKRLRLFGVNMECPMPDDSDRGVPDVAFSPHCPSSSFFRPPN